MPRVRRSNAATICRLARRFRPATAAGLRASAANDNKIKFTSKERDAETGLDYFLARYYSGAQGRFTSSDPVMFAPERLRDPQQLNRYAYARNNPLRFLDPTGERLQLSGDVNEAQKQLCEMLGTSDCASRMSYDEKTNTITVDIAGLGDNEGAILLDQLVGSSKLYDLTIGTEFMTSAGMTPLTDPSAGGVANLNHGYDSQFMYHGGRLSHEKPATGVDGIVAINPALAKYVDSKGRRVSLSSLIFHELAEAYGKVDLGKEYSDYHTLQAVGESLLVSPFKEQGAHNYSVGREFNLINQRPSLQLTGRAGDVLIRDPK